MFIKVGLDAACKQRGPSDFSRELSLGLKRAEKRMLARQASRDGWILGSLGAKQGGFARAENLTKQERKDIATHAAKERWK